MCGGLGFPESWQIHWRFNMSKLLYFKWITRTFCIAQGTLLDVMWQPGWEGSLGKNGYMYMYS